MGEDNFLDSYWEERYELPDYDAEYYPDERERDDRELDDDAWERYALDIELNGYPEEFDYGGANG